MQNPRARVPQSCTCIKCDCGDATFPFKNPDIGWRMADHKVAVTSEFVRIKSNEKQQVPGQGGREQKDITEMRKTERYGDMTKGKSVTGRRVVFEDVIVPCAKISL